MAYSITFIRTIAAANETIATFDQQGTFLKDRQKEVELLHHYVSMDEWQSYMAVEAQFYEKPDDRLLESVRAHQGNTGGEIILTEWMRLIRYRRSG